ncbi:MAG: DUF3100 domain-containing protein, partial [Proteobacteria bacterium]|nr:DUF3100 domain-containing protein [Pseudomonadota bacterium]
HLVILLICIMVELVGLHKFKVGPATILLIPFVFAFIAGVLLTPAITEKYWKSFKKTIGENEQKAATACITMGITLFIGKLAVLVGANMDKIIQGGLAMVLQEFGNIGSILFAVPVAVIVLKMKRETIGASFSVCREPSLALASEKWGLQSEAGLGAMGVYIVGTVFGAVFFSILGSVFVSLGIFHPYSLGMAAGVGSASMMTAAAATIKELVTPEQQELVMAYAAASNLITTATGMYMSLYLGIPMTKWLYKKLSGDSLEDFVESGNNREELTVGE